ncbi:MAG: hypothetical protein NZL92_04440 [Gloeomargarita sp. SKYG116]|nr:hypothetical protein [Gloeomargarita sp. SKYG116]MDW8400925.1 hypothetical protein [Gloeomargarita sp. SKYGB_i_bin116]
MMTDLSFVLFCLFLSVILLIISALALVTCTSIALLILAAMQGVDINDIDIQTNYLDLIVAGILMGLFILNGLITMAYLGTVLMFSKLFIIDQNVNFWLAMVCSWRLVKQNFWSWFWFLLLLILTNLGGALLCGLGLGVTIPLTFCSITMAYLDVMNRAT